jgi:hypothetical protein
VATDHVEVVEATLVGDDRRRVLFAIPSVGAHLHDGVRLVERRGTDAEDHVPDLQFVHTLRHHGSPLAAGASRRPLQYAR